MRYRKIFEYKSYKVLKGAYDDDLENYVNCSFQGHFKVSFCRKLKRVFFIVELEKNNILHPKPFWIYLFNVSFTKKY